MYFKLFAYTAYLGLQITISKRAACQKQENYGNMLLNDAYFRKIYLEILNA